MLSLREGFFAAGMRAEVDFLIASKFTGEVSYWRDGGELRRKMTNVSTGENGDATTSAKSEREAKIRSQLEGWVKVFADSPIRILFKAGSIRKIEW